MPQGWNVAWLGVLLGLGGCAELLTPPQGSSESVGEDTFPGPDDDDDEGTSGGSGGDSPIDPSAPDLETGGTGMPGEETGEPPSPPDDGGALPGGGLQLDFDCIHIDRVQGPRVVPPAGLQVGFRVLDCNGDPIPQLTAADLQVINDEKGAPFGIGGEGGGFSDLGTPSEYALVSVLALDLSDSIVLGGKLDDVIDGALVYLDGVEAAASQGVEHDVAVVVFARPAAFEVVQPFTTDVAAVRATLEGLRGAPSEGSTDLYGAYTRAIALAEGRAAELDLVERFVVVLTDGTHEAGQEEELRQAALAERGATEAHVFTIGIDGAYDPGRLAELATTAENFIRVENATRLSEAFQEIAARVDAIARSNYVVGVCSPVALGEPSLTVEVVVDGSDGSTPADAFTLAYPVTHLDGNTSACDPDEIAGLRLRCSGTEPCEVTCLDVECGCDDGTVCGTCDAGSMCSAEGVCVAGEGPGPGDLTCTSPAWAHGVTLTDVDVHQGSGFPLARGGSALGLDLQAPVVAGRDALIRASISVAAGFVPRPLRAELHLRSAGGEVEVFTDERFVSGPIPLSGGAAALQWRVPGDRFTSGTRWSIQVLEVEGIEGSTTPVRLPADADADLAVTAPKVMKVQLVPVRHSVGTCSRTADVAGVADALVAQLEAAAPVESLQIDIATEVYPFTQSLDPNTWVSLVSGLSAWRSSRGLPNDVFLYGVVDPCGSTSGIGGIGYVPNQPTSSRSGPYRTSVGLADPWIFVHELGHNLGRPHVGCSGGEAGVDPAYPHPAGRTGSWGWDLRSGTMQSPERKDFMSYCSDRWVSDYGWSFALAVLDGISTWADTAASQPRTSVAGSPMADGGVMGVIRLDGTSQWWTTPDAPEITFGSTVRVRMLTRGGGTREVDADWAWLSDDQTLAVRAPMVVSAAELAAVEIPDLTALTGIPGSGSVRVDAAHIQGLTRP